MNPLHVTSNREKIAMRISWYSIAVNVFLSLGKFAAGIFGHSAAMVSDAIHSASDWLRHAAYFRFRRRITSPHISDCATAPPSG